MKNKNPVTGSLKKRKEKKKALLELEVRAERPQTALS